MRAPSVCLERPRRAGRILRWLFAVTIAAVVLALVTGCTLLSEDTDTPGQGFYAAQQDYRALIALAADYRDFCAAKPQHARGDCVGHVQELQRIVNETVHPAYEAALAALVESGGAKLAFATRALAAGLAQLQSYLLDHHLQEVLGQSAMGNAYERLRPPLRPILAKGELPI